MDDKKLEQAMKEKNVSVAEMCKALGLSRSAFYRKRKGISEFTHSEIQKIVNILDSEVLSVFFLPSRCPKRHKLKKKSPALRGSGGKEGNAWRS